MKRIAEHGFWRSPFTSELVARESLRLLEPRISDGSVYWLEGRPAESGRTALVRWDSSDGSVRDELDAPWSVGTRVHEYGGGAYAAVGGTICFSERRHGQIHVARSGEDPRPVVPADARRYADLEIDAERNRLLAVCEDHTAADREAQQSIIAMGLEGCGERPTMLRTGADFYSNPRLSPDGRRLCWLQWQHPNMPWDGTELWVGSLGGGGAIVDARRVAGGASESIFQPQWSPDGTLHFVSDRTGYWNLYRVDGEAVTPLHERRAEFGLPQWVFGMSTYGIAADGTIVCSYCEAGVWTLATLSPGGEMVPLATPYTQIDGVSVQGSVAVFRGASPSEPPAVIRINVTSGDRQVIRRSTDLSDGLKDCLSEPKAISIPSAGGRTVQGFYYPPCNPDFAAPPDEKPPLLIRLHGGPTAAASNALSLAIQFWTSRGFAALDLNYTGSTGFGRAYREGLNGNWGVADVQDAVAAGRYCAAHGMADPERIAVRGGSAGGYTVLCSLAFHDEFAAGASYYGISDLKALALETHKFESRYHETLIGPWPESIATYEYRSPLGSADKVVAPTIFFQGSDDPVVPKEQTEAMVEALRSRRVPVAYFLFEGEAHGFRDAAHVIRALEGELTFYGMVLLRKGLRY